MEDFVDSQLYKRTTWLNKNIDFSFGSSIIEYDMKSAGLSLIKEFKMLPDDEIQKLEALNKQSRNIKIGLMQKKNKGFAKELLVKFVEARKRFIISNRINENNILSIKKDAIFVIDRECDITDFGHIHFVPKNKYTSFIKLNKLEFYINTRTRQVDVKGLGQAIEDRQELHEYHDEYLLSFIVKFCSMRENMVERKIAQRYLSSFIKKYLNKELPIGYYRELDRAHPIRLRISGMDKDICMREYDRIEDVIINFNYFMYILPLVSLYI